MTLQKTAALLTLLGSLAAAPSIAHATDVYTTVDSYQVHVSSILTVKGILQGAATATETLYQVNSMDGAKRCDALALLVITHPGKYLLEVSNNACRLTRR
jgi:hypothetical protein